MGLTEDEEWLQTLRRRAQHEILEMRADMEFEAAKVYVGILESGIGVLSLPTDDPHIGQRIADAEAALGNARERRDRLHEFLCSVRGQPHGDEEGGDADHAT